MRPSRSNLVQAPSHLVWSVLEHDLDLRDHLIRDRRSSAVQGFRVHASLRGSPIVQAAIDAGLFLSTRLSRLADEAFFVPTQKECLPGGRKVPAPPGACAGSSWCDRFWGQEPEAATDAPDPHPDRRRQPSPPCPSSRRTTSSGSRWTSSPSAGGTRYRFDGSVFDEALVFCRAPKTAANTAPTRYPRP